MLIVIHKMKKNENLLSRKKSLLFIQISVIDIIFRRTKQFTGQNFG